MEEGQVFSMFLATLSCFPGVLSPCLSGDILAHDIKHSLILWGDKEQAGKVAMLGDDDCSGWLEG